MRVIAAQRVTVSAVAFFQEGPGLRNWQWIDSGMKVINGTNIRDDGRFDPSNTTRAISLEEFKAKYQHFAIDANDIVVASSGTLGKAARIKAEHLPMMMNTSVIRFRSKDLARLDDGFLFAWLRSRDFLDQALGMATGAAQQNFGPSHVKQMTLPLPAITTQRRIASILSAYDDLIENNTRRIAILEEMARRIYEEWFVRFRFPGHEAVRMVESELGLVPEGWGVRRLGEEIELAYGKALKAEDRTPGAVPVYGSSGVVGQHHESLVAGPGIIVGRKGNVGSVHWSETPFFPIDTVFYVRTSLPLHYVYFNLQRQNFLNNDAAVPGLNRNQAYALPLIIPLRGVLNAFDSLCQRMLGLARVLARKNLNLRTTRDLLLPKLISGELDVSELPAPETVAA